jgi:hypothetical protein
MCRKANFTKMLSFLLLFADKVNPINRKIDFRRSLREKVNNFIQLIGEDDFIDELNIKI